jgi:hypothetical protein
MLDERQPQPLGEDQVLEPVDELDPEATDSRQAPLVRDVEGRLWRVRRRGPQPAGWVPLLIGLLLALAAIALLH